MANKAEKLAEMCISEIATKTGSLSKKDYIEFCTVIVDFFSSAREVTEQELSDEDN